MVPDLGHYNLTHHSNLMQITVGIRILVHLYCSFQNQLPGSVILLIPHSPARTFCQTDLTSLPRDVTTPAMDT